MGVVHLMDMMTDMEALRNEVLLLLIGLTHANPSIQQIAAFEGAFERLLHIVRYDLQLKPRWFSWYLWAYSVNTWCMQFTNKAHVHTVTGEFLSAWREG